MFICFTTKIVRFDTHIEVELFFYNHIGIQNGFIIVWTHC